MSMVNLKNGTVENIASVTTTMINLRKLDAITLYELHQKCLDPNHILFGNTGENLQKISLVTPEGTIHDSVKNIVLSACRGEGLELKLSSPIQE